ncbi:MAG: lyase family protein, partial [Gammaproteobacteria bacterium]|nr:lyase family protein [Gammaproteobacteria bacterium]
MLTAISPLDGRYRHHTEQLRSIVSEYGLIFYRLDVELKWLTLLANNTQITEIKPLTKDESDFLKTILNSFNEKEAEHIKQIEKKTNHDVKLDAHATLKRLSPFIHFACTSEDINNLAYALMIKKTRDTVLFPQLNNIIKTLDQLANDTADCAMLSRTHGQPATPTTLGKEFKNFSIRLRAQLNYLMEIPISGKCNGAVGNYNAHVVAYP